MKKIILFIICTLVMSCEKEFSDFRKKYTGNFAFVVKEHSVSGIAPYTVHDTTYNNSGNIENGSEENSVVITIPGISLQAKIYNEGSLEGYFNNNGNGEFTSTKEMQYTWGGYSPGGSITYTITGTKN
jgi:hypothetical protein